MAEHLVENHLAAASVPVNDEPSQPSAFGWLGKMNTTERRTWFACFGGLGLDAMDSQAYSLVIPSLLIALHMTKAQAGTFATATLVGGGIGGWLFGYLADKYGRIRMLQVSILIVAVATFSSAFATTYLHLLVARSIQGFGYGGEAAIGAVLVSEIIRPRLRGRVTASVQSGYAVGYAIAVGFMALVFHFAKEAIAWRILFALGILPVFFLLYIRKYVPESPLYLQSKNSPIASHRKSHFSEIFKTPLRTRTVTATLLATGIIGAAYVQIIWLPTYLRTVQHLDVTHTAGYLFLNILGSFLGPLLCGPVSDKMGRRWTFVVFLALQAVTVGVYTMAPISHSWVFVLGFVVGTLQGGLGSGMLPAFAELFPTHTRGHGQGFCLSVGRGMGSFIPTGVGFASKALPLGTAMGTFAIGAYVLGIIAALCLPETVGKNLQEG
jgi:MFS family permease